jgi:hypothetical protein
LIVRFKDKQEQTVKCADPDDEVRQVELMQGRDQAAKMTVYRAHMIHELETRWNRTPYEPKQKPPTEGQP